MTPPILKLYLSCLISGLLLLLNLPVLANTSSIPQLLDALQAAEKNIPRDSFEPSAVVPQTELTPDSLNTWVKVNTWLIPYQGALRDAQGVLMDRVGNSLDRALLLQALLRELGYDTRLAQATLSEEQARQVLSARRPLPASTLPTSPAASAHTEQLIKDFNLDANQFTQLKAKAEQNQQQLKNTLQERVTKQTAELLNLLGSTPEPPPDESYKALQDHWWVQYQEKDQWFDLDPTLPAELAKHIHPTPSKIHTLTKLSDLAPELLHTVQVKVILECAQDRKLTEHVLTQTPAILPSAVLGQPFSVNHLATDLPSHFNASDLDTFKKTLLAQEQWFPLVTVADQQYFDQAYTAQCQLSKAKPPQAGTAIDKHVGEVLDVLDATESTPSPTTSTSTAFITALWLEYEIHTPNQPPQTLRRPLFDLIGAAQRAETQAITPLNAEQQLAWRLALLGSTAILATGATVSDDYLTLLAAQQLLQLREPILNFVQATGSAPLDNTDLPPLLPANLYALASLRQKLLPPSQPATQLNLLSLHHYLQFDQPDELSYRQAFDIVSNELDATASLPFAERLRQGVLDTNLEALLLEQTCNKELAICQPSVNTANAWQQSQSSDWQVVRTTSEMATLSFNADIKTQVQHTLNAGYWVVLPKQPLVHQPILTWWRVHPVTGLTLGMDERGWGVSISEYLLLARTGLLTGACVLAASKSTKNIMGCIFLGVIGGASWGVVVSGAQGAGAAWLYIAIADALKVAYITNKASQAN